MPEQHATATADYADDYPYRPQPAAIVMVDRAVDIDQLDDFWQLGQSQAGLIGAVCLGLFFAVVNIAVSPLMAAIGGPANNWQILPVFASFGAILSECGLLSAWLVFASGSFWLRAASCWMAALVLWLCWGAGTLVAPWIGYWPLEREMLTGSLALPLVALTIQTPLWFARSYFGWRLVHQAAETAPRAHLSIRDYFVGTAIAAVSIAFARLGRPPSVSPETYWAGWSIGVLCSAAGGLLGVLPGMLLIFRLRFGWLGFALFVLYGLAVSLGVIGIIDAASPTSPSMMEYAIFATVFISLAACLGAGMLVARGCGYKLLVRSEN
jgi:hypothetical protein